MTGLIWDLQYEFIALVMLVLFIAFYHLQRIFPMFKNTLFSRIMWVEFACILFDILGCYMDSYVSVFPLWLIQVVNVIYFLFLYAIYYNFYYYCRASARERAKASFRRWVGLRIPFYLVEILTVLTPFTGWIFSIDPVDGYTRGPLYYIIGISYLLFYMIASMAFVIYYRKSIPLKERCSMYLFAFIVTLTVFVQAYGPSHLLITNLGISLGIAILFLAAQNPEYDKDKKTRVFNSDGFDRYIGEQLRMGKPVQIIGVCFANYTNIRSIYGSQNTDEVLNRIGIHFKNHFRNVDSFYMHDGRFAMVLHHRRELYPLVGELEKYFRRTFHIAGDEVDLKFRAVYFDLEHNLKIADEVDQVLWLAMDMACRSDDDGVHTIDQTVIENMRKEQAVRAALHEAVTHETDRVKVFYQPIYDRDSGNFISAEALVRIIDPELGLLPPDSFIRLAEEDGTILRLGKMVFTEVCRFISENDMKALGLEYIEVNLSPIQCMHKNLPQELIAIAQEKKVPLSYINFEITETALIDDKDLLDLMKPLIEAGSSFSLDDYGTGYSNLINVLSLPYHIIKVDKSIAWSYFEGKDAVLPKIVTMLNEEGYTIVAEGVETETMTNDLQTMGCRFIQGYYYSKPVAEEQFLQFLKDRKKS